MAAGTSISSFQSRFTTGTIAGTVTNIGISPSVAEIDVTGLSDTEKQFVTGTFDGGVVDVSCNVDLSTAVVQPTSGNATTTAFVVQFGKGAAGIFVPTWSFSGYIVKTTVNAEVDKQVTVNYSIQISGAITVATVATA